MTKEVIACMLRSMLRFVLAATGKANSNITSKINTIFGRLPTIDSEYANH